MIAPLVLWGKRRGDALRLGQKLKVEDGEGSEICRWNRGLDWRVYP